MDENKLNQTEDSNEPVLPSAPEQDVEVDSLASDNFETVEESEVNTTTHKAECEPQPTYVYRWNYEEQAAYDREASRQHNRKGLKNYAIALSAALLSAIVLLVGVLIFDPSPSSTAGPVASLASLYDECYPSYVAISVITDRGTSGAGSGIIMTQDGYIATNHHVVEDAETIEVILYDGTTIPADYVDGDELNDVAIIKVAKKGLQAAKIGTSADMKVGDQVMAIGTPFSISYRGTMTSGYVSATNRMYAATNDNGTINKVLPLLQTDTSINPGNSGGPLFNMQGEVVGIVSMKIAGSEYEGLGFAIPIDGVIDMLYDIIANGKITDTNGGSAVEGAGLGITGMTVVKDVGYLMTSDQIITTVLNAQGERCVQNYLGEYIPITDTETLASMGITDFEIYPAPATGVRVAGTTPGFDSSKKLVVDDVIVSVNGIDCTKMEVLQGVIANSRVGDKLTLEVVRNGETLTLSVELGRSADIR